MFVDFVSGRSESVGDGSPIWHIADAVESLSLAGASPRVRRHTCGTELQRFLVETAGSGTPLTTRIWIVYSYGCARMWKDLADLKSQKRSLATIDHLVIIAGVPRFWDGQFEISDAWGVWHMDANIIKAATCFSPLGFCLPQSQPIKNPSPFFQNQFIAGVDHSSIVKAAAPAILRIAGSHLKQEAAVPSKSGQTGGAILEKSK